MNLKPFFVDALASALDLGVGTPEDILKHVTPDVLSVHLPRPLWARLLTACLGAPKVDATLIVETIGIANLCEHVPAPIIWSCIYDIAQRSLGMKVDTAPKPAAAPVQPRAPLTAPPPDAAPQPMRVSSSAPVAAGPAIPLPSPLSDLVAELEAEEPVARPRTATSNRFRASNTGIGRPLGSGSVRRPQAAAAPAASTPARTAGRRGSTEVTDGDVPVDDSQLVDWRADGGNDDDDDFKR